MNVGSLFSGIGGVELGFERAGGFETKWFVENDIHAQTLLRKHWPNAEVYADITAVDFTKVPRVDVLTGGFPCQDISNAGKRAGIEGSRSSLWKHYLRAISEIRPRYAFIENVSALLNRGLDVVLSDLASVGYDAEWHCISASSVGALHKRDRIFIIAYPNDDGRSSQGYDEVSGANCLSEQRKASVVGEWEERKHEVRKSCSNVADTFGNGSGEESDRGINESCMEIMADTDINGCELQCRKGSCENNARKDNQEFRTTNSNYLISKDSYGEISEQSRGTQEIAGTGNDCSCQSAKSNGICELVEECNECNRVESKDRIAKDYGGTLVQEGCELEFAKARRVGTCQVCFGYCQVRQGNDGNEKYRMEGQTSNVADTEQVRLQCSRKQGSLGEESQISSDQRSESTSSFKEFGSSSSSRRRERDKVAGNWAVEPDVGRVADGVSLRVDRIKRLGNAVVPACAEVFAKAIKQTEERLNDT